MAKEQKMVRNNAMKIEDIRMFENILFWVERLAIATLIFFPTINSYLSNFAAFVLMNAVDPIYFLLTLERQQIRRFFFEPDLIFYVERVTIKYWLFFYYRDSGFAPGSGIALAIVIFTNLLMLKDLIKFLDKISSHSSNTMDAKETSTKIDQKKEENADVELLEKKVELEQKEENADVELLEKKVELKQKGEGEFVILEEANKEERFANDDPWFSDYLSVWDSSVPANGDIEEALPRSTTPTPNPYPIDHHSELLKSQGWFEEGPFFFGELPEHIEHSSGSMEIQMEDQEEATVAGSDKPFDNHLKEHLSCDEIDLSLPNESEVEAKDGIQEAASSTNYKSDGDSSWEEVQNSVDDGKLGAEIADNSDQKKTDELEEAGEEEEEATSSWVAGEIDLNERMQREEERAERLHEEELAERLRGYEAMMLKVEQEKKDLTEKLEQQRKDLTEKHEAATKQYKENYSKLQKEVSVKCTDMITGLKCELLGVDIDKLQAKLDAANKQLEIYQVSEKEFEEERCIWNEERQDLYLKLDGFVEKRHSWNEEREELYSKLDDATMELENYQVIENNFEEERLKWNEEKKNLNSELDAATALLQEERLKWEEEKGQLLLKLETTANDFAEERGQWDEEKRALLATITHADENVQYCQNLVNVYAEQCGMGRMQHINSSTHSHSLDKLTKERDDLAARVDDEKSMVESYKGLYDQSEEHCQYYKACFEEYEQKYLKLKEENLEISAKLFTETSFSERYKKIVNELEDKCRRLEDEKNDVNAKLCAAKASSELYRSCLLDFF
ncbi:hypothetical protein COLO4_17349 [Corchorus olitorius]|uniref:Uncharacterized protein n=1 Tax=Corchorus olitorius TaxID=93759 RepID=A0A1R3JD53_9ROSI|nr:hypothetical protein COLO4_17349 [Corchorus olitorius]